MWLTGSLVVTMWVTLPRVWLAVTSRRSRLTLPLDCPDRAWAIAERVGWRHPIRLLAVPRLAGPIAFGMLRPGVAVPVDFWARHNRAEQDVMLAHELAHLAVRDPLWLALTDVLSVLLWWHPLVWWGRRQFRAASEAAADEASLVVEDGPAVLAGCLVALASQWQRRGVLSVWVWRAFGRGWAGGWNGSCASRRPARGNQRRLGGNGGCWRWAAALRWLPRSRFRPGFCPRKRPNVRRCGSCLEGR